MKISILKNAVSAKDFVCSATKGAKDFVCSATKGAKDFVCSAIKGTKALVGNPRVAMVFTLLFVFTLGMFAQNTAGDYSAGTTALGTVTTEIAKYVPVVVKLCYAIAGVVAVVGAISIYIAMNNEENDIKKKIMMTVGACIFLVAAAQALPLFFGVTN